MEIKHAKGIPDTTTNRRYNFTNEESLNANGIYSLENGRVAATIDEGVAFVKLYFNTSASKANQGKRPWKGEGRINVHSFET